MARAGGWFGRLRRRVARGDDADGFRALPYAAARRRADEVIDCGEIVWCVEVHHAGTRSEGRTGRLYRNEQELGGASPGEVVTGRSGSTVVQFEFVGWERPHLWSTSGWRRREPGPPPGPDG